MEMIRLLILYKDKEYGFALARTISNLHKDFLVTAEAYDAFAHKELTDPYDLLLVEGREEELRHSSTIAEQQVVILVDTPGEKLEQQLNLIEDGRRIFCLYKYVSVGRLVADLRYIYGYFTGRKNLVRHPVETQVMGFYSASGGTGKSIVAISAARELRKYHDKMVLYLSFDLISAAPLYMKGETAQRGLEDYLYYLFSKDKGVLCSYLDSFVFVDEYGVHTFLHSGDINELNQLSGQELSYFMEFLLTSNKYDYIILDLPACFHDGTRFLSTLCSKLFLIESNCPVSHYKTEKFKTYLSKSVAMDGMNSLLIPVINKGSPDDHLRNPLPSTCEEEAPIIIERDNSSFRLGGDHLDISLNHLFGMGIRKIVDEII